MCVRIPAGCMSEKRPPTGARAGRADFPLGAKGSSLDENKHGFGTAGVDNGGVGAKSKPKFLTAWDFYGFHGFPVSYPTVTNRTVPPRQPPLRSSPVHNAQSLSPAGLRRAELRFALQRQHGPPGPTAWGNAETLPRDLFCHSNAPFRTTKTTPWAVQNQYNSLLDRSEPPNNILHRSEPPKQTSGALKLPSRPFRTIKTAVWTVQNHQNSLLDLPEPPKHHPGPFRTSNHQNILLDRSEPPKQPSGSF